MNKNRKKIKLSQVYNSWSTGNGIFRDMLKVYPDLPWKEHISPNELDLEYFGNHSGNKEISPLIAKIISKDGLSQEQRESIAKLIVFKNIINWTKSWETMFFEYNPIENYDRKEDTTTSQTGQEIDTFTNGKSVTYTKTGSIINKDGDNSQDVFTKEGDIITKDNPNSQDIYSKIGKIKEADGRTITNTKTGNEVDMHTGIKKVTTTNNDLDDYTVHSDTDYVKGFDSASSTGTDTIVNFILEGEGGTHIRENDSNSTWAGANKKVIADRNTKNGSVIEETEYFKDSLDQDYKDIHQYENIIDNEIHNGSIDTEYENYQEITQYQKNSIETYDDYKETQLYQKSQEETYNDYTENTVNSGADTNTKDFKDRKETINGRVHGNIGVTTSQQMIQSERSLWDWQYFDKVFKDIDKILTTGLYVDSEDDLSDFEPSSYTLPIATSDILGGVKAISKTTEKAQVAIDKEGFLWYVPGEGNVKSVNGKTGEVTITLDELNGVSLTAFNTLDSTVDTILMDQSEMQTDINDLKNKQVVTSVNGASGDVTIAIPDVPVKSVNNKVGDVKLSASDVGAPSTSTFNSLKNRVSTVENTKTALSAVNFQTGQSTSIKSLEINDISDEVVPTIPVSFENGNLVTYASSMLIDGAIESEDSIVLDVVSMSKADDSKQYEDVVYTYDEETSKYYLKVPKAEGGGSGGIGRFTITFDMLTKISDFEYKIDITVSDFNMFSFLAIPNYPSYYRLNQMKLDNTTISFQDSGEYSNKCYEFKFFNNGYSMIDYLHIVSSIGNRTSSGSKPSVLTLNILFTNIPDQSQILETFYIDCMYQ